MPASASLGPQGKQRTRFGFGKIAASGLFAVLPLSSLAMPKPLVADEPSHGHTLTAPTTVPVRQVEIDGHIYSVNVVETPSGPQEIWHVVGETTPDPDKPEMLEAEYEGERQEVVVSIPGAEGPIVFGYTQIEGAAAQHAFATDPKWAQDFRAQSPEDLKTADVSLYETDIWASAKPSDDDLDVLKQSGQKFLTQISNADNPHVPPIKKRKRGWQRVGAAAQWIGRSLVRSAEATFLKPIAGFIDIAASPITVPYKIKQYHREQQALDAAPVKVRRFVTGRYVNTDYVSQQEIDAAFQSGGLDKALALFLSGEAPMALRADANLLTAQLPASTPSSSPSSQPTTTVAKTSDAAVLAPSEIAQSEELDSSSWLMTAQREGDAGFLGETPQDELPLVSGFVASSAPQALGGGSEPMPLDDVHPESALLHAAGSGAETTTATTTQTPPVLIASSRPIESRTDFNPVLLMLCIPMVLGTSWVLKESPGAPGVLRTAVFVPKIGKAINGYAKNLWGNRDSVLIGMGAGLVGRGAAALLAHTGFAAAATAVTAHGVAIVAGATIAAMATPWIISIGAAAVLGAGVNVLRVAVVKAWKKEKFEKWWWAKAMGWGALGGSIVGAFGQEVHGLVSGHMPSVQHAAGGTVSQTQVHTATTLGNQPGLSHPVAPSISAPVGNEAILNNARDGLRDALSKGLLDHDKALKILAQRAADHGSSNALLQHALKEVSAAELKQHDAAAQTVGRGLISCGTKIADALHLHDVNSFMLKRDFQTLGLH